MWSNYSGKYDDEGRRASPVRRIRRQRPGKEEISATSTSSKRQSNENDTERNSVNEKAQQQQQEETTTVEVEFLTPAGGGVVTKQAAMARAKALPLDKLLEALDRRNIRYHVKATRVQLEAKLADEIMRTHSRLLAEMTAANNREQHQGAQPNSEEAKDKGGNTAAGNNASSASTAENGTRQQQPQQQQQPNFEFYSRNNNALLGEGTTIDVEVTTIGDGGNNNNNDSRTRTSDRRRSDVERRSDAERRPQARASKNSRSGASSSAGTSEQRAQARRQQRQSTGRSQSRPGRGRGGPSGTRYEYDRAGTPYSPIDPALIKDVVSTGGRAAKSLLNTAKYTASKALDTFDQWWDGDDGAEEPEWMYVRKDPTTATTGATNRPSRSSHPKKSRAKQEANRRPYSPSSRSKPNGYDARGRYNPTDEYVDEEARQRIIRRRKREARQRQQHSQAAPSYDTTTSCLSLALPSRDAAYKPPPKATVASATATTEPARRGRRRNNGVDYGDNGDKNGIGNNDNERAPHTRTRRQNTAPGAEQNENVGKRRAQSRASGGRNPSSNYWRDRLTERVDNLLGLNDDQEKVYDEWAQKEKLRAQRRQRDEGDPFSVLMGDEINHARPSNRGRKPRNGRRDHKDTKQAFWQEQGSLSALLFGRPGHKLSSRSTFKELFDKELFRKQSSVNVMTLSLRAAFKTSVIAVGYLCEWASVRGALPQPLVVFSVITAVLSVRRRRIMAMVLTLLALRTCGELVHGYKYGHEDELWHEDEDGYGYNDDDDDNDDNRRMKEDDHDSRKQAQAAAPPPRRRRRNNAFNTT